MKGSRLSSSFLVKGASVLKRQQELDEIIGRSELATKEVEVKEPDPMIGKTIVVDSAA